MPRRIGACGPYYVTRGPTCRVQVSRRLARLNASIWDSSASCDCVTLSGGCPGDPSRSSEALLPLVAVEVSVHHRSPGPLEVRPVGRVPKIRGRLLRCARSSPENLSVVLRSDPAACEHRQGHSSSASGPASCEQTCLTSTTLGVVSASSLSVALGRARCRRARGAGWRRPAGEANGCGRAALLKSRLAANSTLIPW